MNQEWSWTDAVKIIGVPTALGFFAYSHVIGYFLATDISWFPFFTLSEHVVFAIRALPLAVGASLIFLIMMQMPELINSRWLAWFWILALVSVAALAFLSNHITMFTIVGLMAFFEGLHRFNTRPMPPADVLYWAYWAANLMIVSIISGFLSAMTWVLDPSPLLHLPLTSWTIIELKPSVLDKTTISGHVMFTGQSTLIFYDPEKGGTTLLLRLEDIRYIKQCRHYRLGDHPDDHRSCK